MPLRGNLRDFSTDKLLNLISLAHKTGTLTIQGPTEAARMAFREGKLIFAQVGNEDPSLAFVLRKVGKLTDEQARALRQRAEAANDKALGLLLINSGYVTQSEILQSIKQHILDVAYRLFTWVEGIFNFEANATPPAERITVPIDLDNVIIEGSRRMREWEQLQEELPNLDLALKKLFAASENVDVQFRAEFFNILNHANFSAPSQTTIWEGRNLTVNEDAGLVTSTVNTARQIQFGLKLLW